MTYRSESNTHYYFIDPSNDPGFPFVLFRREILGSLVEPIAKTVTLDSAKELAQSDAGALYGDDSLWVELEG